MTREEIISGLKFTVGMFLFDPSTGEKYTEPRNDMDKTTIDACRGAIELLEQEPILDKIRAEIKEWYWQVDKQALAKDPCVVDAMIDLFIRTIDKYQTEKRAEKHDKRRFNTYSRRF